MNCPIDYAIGVVGGKWKAPILWLLSNNQIMRYGEIKKTFTGISHKTLSLQLKELESDSLIIRKQYDQIPPKVEYSLTAKGTTVVPILVALSDWARENMPESGVAENKECAAVIGRK
jgi:DNA-binding HxlR family transcriptional regulator